MSFKSSGPKIIILLNVLIAISSYPLRGYTQLKQSWFKVITASSNMKYDWPIARYGTGRDHISISKTGSYVGIICNSGVNPYLASFSTGDGSLVFQNTHAISASGGGIDYDSTDNLYVLSRIDKWGDSYLRKFTANGVLSYTKTIANYDEDYMFMLSAKGGRVNVFGKNKKQDQTNTHTNYNYSTDGTLKWQSTISDYDWFYGYTVPFVTDKLGNVFMTGKRQSSGDPQSYDAVVRKLDSNGVQKWQIYIDQGNRQDYVADIITDEIGDVYASLDNGGTSPVPSYLVKINGITGAIVWRRTFTRTDNLKLSTKGGRVFVMEEGGSFYALDVSNGNIVWSTKGLSGSYSVETDPRGTSYLISAGSDDSIRVVNNQGQILSNLKVTLPGYSARIQSLTFDRNATYFYISGVCVQGGTNHMFIAKYETPYTDSLNQMASDTLGLHISNVKAVCNRSVDVPVRVTAFRNLLTLQGSLTWDASDLRFDSITNFGPAQLALNNTNFGSTQSAAGRLSFSWNDPNSSGVTLPDTTTIFTLRFTALTNGVKSVPIAFADTPAALEAYAANLAKKPLALANGTVSVTCEFILSGRILTPTDRGVRNARVTLSGGTTSQTAITDTAGNYSFKSLPGTYTLTPSKAYEQNKSNGISTFDLALMQSHILQRSILDAAYKVIAADANNSASVTTADIIMLRRLILGTDTSLPDNRLWAFVDADQIFSNITNPFPFNATKTFTNLSANVSHTFRGIKIGDVNYDRNPLLDQAPSGDTLLLFTEWTEADDGTLTLKIRARSLIALLGYQSTLCWDPTLLRFEGILANPTEIGVGQRWTDEGYLALSWNDPQARGINFTDGLLLLEMRFRKVRPFDRTALRISEEKIATEAFNANFQSVGVRLQSADLKGGSWQGTMRVFPNPAVREVNIEWRQEKRGAATIRLIDAVGRVVYKHSDEYQAGVNSKRIEIVSSLQSGVLTVQVEADGSRQVLSLVKAK